MAALLVQIIALTITQFTVLVGSQALVGEFFKLFLKNFLRLIQLKLQT